MKSTRNAHVSIIRASYSHKWQTENHQRTPTTFEGWSGACSRGLNCKFSSLVITMSYSQTVNANKTFNRQRLLNWNALESATHNNNWTQNNISTSAVLWWFLDTVLKCNTNKALTSTTLNRTGVYVNWNLARNCAPKHGLPAASQFCTINSLTLQ